MHEVIEVLRRFRDQRNWAEFHTPKDLAISVSIEAGELLELFQWQSESHDLSAPEISRVADEASDVLLYLLMLFDRLGLDPSEEAMKKININSRRFPVEKVLGKPGSKISKRVAG